MKNNRSDPLLIGLLILFGLIFVEPNMLAYSAERVIIATPSRGLSVFPALVSIRKGFYKDEGLEVDMVLMQPTIAVKALISGDANYLLAWGSAVRAAVTGAPIKAVVGLASRPLHVLIARPGIKTPKDLKGKIIGVDAIAGTVDYLSRVALRHFGLEPGKDAKLIVIGESGTRATALRAGSIDATAIDVSLAVKAEDEGFNRLLYLGDIIELPLTGIAVMDKQIQTQREQIKRVIRATMRATGFMKRNRKDTIQMLSDYLHLTPAQAAKTYDASINSFTEDGLVSDAAVNVDVQLAKERLKMTQEIPLRQLVDWSLLRELKAELPK
jgi:ABC-type nitrate/sulfonate/bicarbonate transport system substrate-binding protein